MDVGVVDVKVDVDVGVVDVGGEVGPSPQVHLVQSQPLDAPARREAANVARRRSRRHVPYTRPINRVIESFNGENISLSFLFIW